MDYRGTLYRALNPIWARTPLSGEGAARFGGRFNPRGMPALYTSLRPEIAMREANQAGAFQPITLVAYRADVSRIFDATGLTAHDLADPTWRDTMLAGKEPPTQQLARTLVEQGYTGILVPSFAPGTTPDDRNLVLWAWTGLTLIDDQDRLT